jgi:hypothetical protein
VKNVAEGDPIQVTFGDVPARHLVWSPLNGAGDPDGIASVKTRRLPSAENFGASPNSGGAGAGRPAVAPTRGRREIG